METVERKYGYALSRGRPRHARCDEFSIRHPQMAMGQRAKIFSPFDALKGFSDSIDSKRRLYVEKRELNEEELARLNAVLTRLCELTANGRAARENRVTAEVICFVPCPDEHHEAYGRLGSYERVRGTVWKVDPLVKGTLRIGDREIELSDIAAITLTEED